MNSSDTRNFIIFMVVALVLIGVYEKFVLQPVQQRQIAAHAQAAAAAAAAQKAGVQLAPDGTAIVPHVTREAALAGGQRITLKTPSLSGSINLTGARLDDLVLCGTGGKGHTCYRATTAAGSAPTELLRPAGAEYAYYAVNGWQGANTPDVTNDSTVWTAASADALTPAHPLELTYAAPGGVVFHRQIAVDADYLFTLTDEVDNGGATPVTLSPYGYVARTGVPPDLGKTAMEGAIGVIDGKLQQFKYQQLKKDGQHDFPAAGAAATTGGWLGITDKYWMTSFIPNQSEPLQVQMQVRPVAGSDVYESAYEGQSRTIAPGGKTTEVTHIFAGAKVVQTLNHYKDTLPAPNFDKAVDWGVFEILVKPLFSVLDFYARYLPNFGLAILALTISIRVVLFPFFNASYSMSTKMKKVQPEMKVLQEKFKGDPPGLQKEMMALYAREKINPVTGCLPMLLPLPVFYALSKLFTVTIEMRHAQFGWVKDLSAPDPTTIWNLFGLLPYDPLSWGWVHAAMLAPFVGGIFTLVMHLGAWPIIYAVCMWLSQVTGPPMTGIDPTQQRIMRLMPWIFMFIFAQYSVGLVIYWAFSSVFTFVQQYVLMRRFKVDNPIDDFLARFSRPKAAAET